MRVLAVDAGNSRIKWGIWEDEWSHQGAVLTTQVDELAATWSTLPQPFVIHATNVAGPAVREPLDQWASAHGTQIHWLTSKREQCGVRSGYREPTQLGTDRWASVIAAWHLVRGAAVVVNAGTAVTVEALDGAGVFRGGVIMPGLQMMATALTGNTALLRDAHGAFAAFPDNTADAIATGVMSAVCGAIARMRDTMIAHGETPQVVLGGGAANAIAGYLPFAAMTMPYLVLEGLRIVATSGQSA